MSENTKIYLVQGNCGEYSDYQEWVVCGYRDEAMAQEHACSAKAWLQQNVRYDMPYDERKKLKNPFDSESSLYGANPDTDWTAFGVEIRTSLPKAATP